MKRALPLLCLLLLITACSTTGQEKQKVDKPIADTYVPLKGAGLNHRYSQELEELRAWQDAKTASEAEYAPEPGTISTVSSVPDDRIQEPRPVPAQAHGTNADIEEDEDSLRIRESR